MWKNGLRDKVLAMIAQLKVGDVSDFRNFMGAVIDRPSFENIGAYIAAAKAGPGMKVIAVGGREYSSQRLKDAVAAAATDKAPITLLVKQSDRIDTMKIDYHGGLQYPVLERISGRPDRLAELWKAR